MKIRACKDIFFSKMTEDELLSQILTDMESPEYPQIISNNECSVSLGDENEDNDSPLSFLVKFKASFISPSQIPNGVSGVHLPDGLKNAKHNDNKSFFKSVNENHFNLTIKDETESQNLVDQIRDNEDSTLYYNFDQIKDYLTRNSKTVEWVNFYAQDKKWNRFFRNLMVKSFEEKHCTLSFKEIEEYKANNPDDFESDLENLIKSGYLVNENKKKAVKSHFPKLIS